jgi:hypothetical protein
LKQPEPGYYEEGKFGVRIENLVEVVESRTPHNYAGKKFLTFNTISLCPIQLSLIEPSLLTKREVSLPSLLASPFPIKQKPFVRDVFVDVPMLSETFVCVVFKRSKALIVFCSYDRLQKDWLNEYHREVRERIDPLLKALGDDHASDWLAKNTLPLH